MIPIREISRLFSKFEIYLSERRNADDRHHENSISIQGDVIDKLKIINTLMKDYGNPFSKDS